MKEQFKTELIFYRAWDLKQLYERVFGLPLKGKTFKSLTNGRAESVVKKHLQRLKELSFNMNDEVYDDLLKDYKSDINMFLNEVERLNEPIKGVSLNSFIYDETDESFYLK